MSEYNPFHPIQISEIREICIENLSQQNTTHIYFLYNDKDEIVYVGQARCIYSRFTQHQKSFLDVVKCKYIVINSEHANDFEAYFILKYLPPYNQSIPKSKKYIPLEGYYSMNPHFYSKKVQVLRAINELEIKNLNGHYDVNDLQKVSEYINLEKIIVSEVENE